VFLNSVKPNITTRQKFSCHSNDLLLWFLERKSLKALVVILSIITLMLCFTGCSTDEPIKGPDVYVAGIEGRNAKYWKNGVGVKLTNLTQGSADANSIVVSDGDVYAAGSIYQDGIGKAVYWKNGTLVTLSGAQNSYATSIAVSGSDVYVAGGQLDNQSIPFMARYWKNGTEVVLSDGSSWAYASSIALSGDDVYVAGSEFNGIANVATYWKNGIPVKLGEGTTFSQAYGIVVSDGDVYVVGEESNAIEIVPKYWKNGDAVILPDGAYASSISVSGNDVYVSGGIYYPQYVAVYWKNANMVRLSADSEIATAIAVAVLNNVVYIAGNVDKMRPAFLKDKLSIVTIWKDGVSDPFTDGNEDGYARGIFIVK
jgi:hypothetical protein